MRQNAFALVSVTLSLALPPALAALDLDLVANGELDQDGSSWSTPSPSYVTLDFTAGVDANSCAGSGSLLVTNSEDTTDNAPGPVQNVCLDGDVSGQSFTLSTAVRFTALYDTEQPQAGIVLVFFPAAHCASLDVTTAAAFTSTQGTDWQFLSTQATAPTGTLSIAVILEILKTHSTDPPISAYFDRAFLGPANLVFADDFEIGGACRWSASVP